MSNEQNSKPENAVVADLGPSLESPTPGIGVVSDPPKTDPIPSVASQTMSSISEAPAKVEVEVRDTNTPLPPPTVSIAGTEIKGQASSEIAQAPKEFVAYKCTIAGSPIFISEKNTYLGKDSVIFLPIDEKMPASMIAHLASGALVPTAAGATAPVVEKTIFRPSHRPPKNPGALGDVEAVMPVTTDRKVLEQQFKGTREYASLKTALDNTVGGFGFRPDTLADATAAPVPGSESAEMLIARSRKEWTKAVPVSQVIEQKLEQVKKMAAIPMPAPQTVGSVDLPADAPLPVKDWFTKSLTRKKIAAVQCNDITLLQAITIYETDVAALTFIATRIEELEAVKNA